MYERGTRWIPEGPEHPQKSSKNHRSQNHNNNAHSYPVPIDSLHEMTDHQ